MRTGIKIIFILIIFSGHFAMAKSPESPLSVTKRLYSEALEVVTNNDTGLRQKMAGEIVNRYFDFDTFSEWALYEHWAGISAEKRSHFLALFRMRFTENVVNRLTEPSKKDFKIELVGKTKKSEFTDIKCRVIHEGETTSLTLRWVHRGGRWLLADLTIAKANLVANYQGQFNKIIREQGFDELLRRLKDKKL